jgi:hypothetical protein
MLKKCIERGKGNVASLVNKKSNKLFYVIDL